MKKSRQAKNFTHISFKVIRNVLITKHITQSAKFAIITSPMNEEANMLLVERLNTIISKIEEKFLSSSFSSSCFIALCFCMLAL